MLRCARRLYRTTHATEPTRRNPRGTEGGVRGRYGGDTGEIRGRDGEMWGDTTLHAACGRLDTRTFACSRARARHAGFVTLEVWY